ncbi:MAG: hypothetical protein ACHP8B_16280 [Terriglobales bacterium]
MLSTFGLVVFALLSRRCPYLPLSRTALILALTWSWLFLFIGLRWKARVALAVCAVLAFSLSLTGTHWLAMPIPAAEASAVGTLVQMQFSLEADKSEHHRPGFANTLPTIVNSFPVQRFYEFEYRPKRSDNGTIERFEIAAIPRARPRSCGFSRSFVITSDGVVHYTSESRAATVDDPVLDVPPGLKQSTGTKTLTRSSPFSVCRESRI